MCITLAIKHIRLCDVFNAYNRTISGYTMWLTLVIDRHLLMQCGWRSKSQDIWSCNVLVWNESRVRIAVIDSEGRSFARLISLFKIIKFIDKVVKKKNDFFFSESATSYYVVLLCAILYSCVFCYTTYVEWLDVLLYDMLYYGVLFCTMLYYAVRIYNMVYVCVLSCISLYFAILCWDHTNKQHHIEGAYGTEGTERGGAGNSGDGTGFQNV